MNIVRLLPMRQVNTKDGFFTPQAAKANKRATIRYRISK